MKLWPWTRKIIERGADAHQTVLVDNWTGKITDRLGVERRPYVVYEITNQWTGSVSLRKVYLQ